MPTATAHGQCPRLWTYQESGTDKGVVVQSLTAIKQDAGAAEQAQETLWAASASIRSQWTLF
jgi:hypothetical protein